ncbi:zinc finger protein 57-like [Vespula maculifrons]|uniref:Zinc finger protein 57-like n=1 Tax=Vespula maculifrons TaxID=7453 RepID=A0ABD2C0C7_VESMC
MLKTKRTVNLSQLIHKCMRCGKGYQLHTSLRRHLRLECGVEPKETYMEYKFNIKLPTFKILCVICPNCGRRYKRNDYLLRHKRECQLERTFGCPMCGKKFKRKYHLSRHVNETKHTKRQRDKARFTELNH